MAQRAHAARPGPKAGAAGAQPAEFGTASRGTGTASAPGTSRGPPRRKLGLRTRRGTRGGPDHGHRKAPLATRRTHTGEQASGTGTHGRREDPRVPGMAQGTQETISPLTLGLHTRSSKTVPCQPSSRAGEVSIGRASSAPRTTSTQCDSQDGGRQHESSCGGKGSPTRTCASATGGVATGLRAGSRISPTGTFANGAMRPRRTLPPGPSCGHIRLWSQRQAALHRELPRVPGLAGTGQGAP